MTDIAFISTMVQAPWGGSEQLWTNAARELVADGLSIEACVKHWEPLHRNLKLLAEAGVELLIRRSLPRGRVERVTRKAARQIGIPLADGIPADWAWMATRPPRLACVSMGCMLDDLAWHDVAVRTGVPYLTVLQSHTESCWPTDEQAELWRRVFEGAQAACFVSRHNQELLETQIGSRLKNAVLVQNPVNLPNDQAVVQWPSAPSPLRLACVARLSPDGKGQDLLLRTLALPVWRARDIQVSLVGQGACEQTLRRLADTLGIGDRVMFEGQVSDVAGIWRDHHALALPSRIEGMPLALLEAMLCGRIGIVTDAGGNAEIVEDGVDGFVAEGTTVRAFARTMERAWSRRSEWQQMGLRAHERARTLSSGNAGRAFADLLLKSLPSNG